MIQQPSMGILTKLSHIENMVQKQILLLQLGNKKMFLAQATVMATLGARGFSCMVSGVGHVCIGDLGAHAVAFGRRSISTCCVREKTSGTQGMSWLTFFKIHTTW